MKIESKSGNLFFKFFPANDDGNLLLKLNRPNCDENEGEGGQCCSLSLSHHHHDDDERPRRLFMASKSYDVMIMMMSLIILQLNPSSPSSEAMCNFSSVAAGEQQQQFSGTTTTTTKKERNNFISRRGACAKYDRHLNSAQLGVVDFCVDCCCLPECPVNRVE